MKVMRLWLVITLVLVGLLQLARADAFQDGLTAYERGDYDNAYQVFRSLAEQGHAEAQHYLGLMYEDALGVPKGRCLGGALASDGR